MSSKAFLQVRALQIFISWVAELMHESVTISRVLQICVCNRGAEGTSSLWSSVRWLWARLSLTFLLRALAVSNPRGVIRKQGDVISEDKICQGLCWVPSCYLKLSPVNGNPRGVVENYYEQECMEYASVSPWSTPVVISTDSSDVPSAETTLALVLLYIILKATSSLGGMPCAFRILNISFRWIESTAFLKSKNVIIAERLFFRASSRMRRKDRGSIPPRNPFWLNRRWGLMGARMRLSIIWP